MAGKPKTKLEGLEVKKVDVVDVGADQKADILIRKRDEPKEESVFKKFFHSFVDAFNVAKGDCTAESFDEKMSERNLEKVRDEVWNASYALQNSIASILADNDVANKVVAIHQSIDQFATFAKDAAEKWADFKTTDEVKKTEELADNFEIAKMQEMIEKSCGGGSKNKTKKELGNDPEEKEENDMGLDVSKMSAGEKAFYQELKKKYITEEQPAGGDPTPMPGTQVEKSTGTVNVQEEVAKAVSAAMSEVTKGIQSQMEAVFAPVKKRAEELEQAELSEVAKKYEILGTKPEQLVPVLKTLKETSQEAYENMISTLDAQAEAIEKSGLFSEIGKSGAAGGDVGSMSSNEAWTAIEKRADELMAKETGLTRHQAIDRVCMANPALVHAYEKAN